MNSNHIYIKVLDKKIIRFLNKHHVLTLATSHSNIPYCCSCFYVFREKENDFIFTSDMHTRHAAEMLENNAVAGAIALETTMLGKIQGVQITGMVKVLEGDEFTAAKSVYLKRFPIARLAALVLWQMKPDMIKYTDNRLGIGKKMIWENNIQVSSL